MKKQNKQVILALIIKLFIAITFFSFLITLFTNQITLALIMLIIFLVSVIYLKKIK